MGIYGQGHAERAAREIREEVQHLLDHATEPQAIQMLLKVLKKSEEIEEAAEAGWY